MIKTKKKTILIVFIVLIMINFHNPFFMVQNASAEDIDFPLQPNSDQIIRALNYLQTNQEADGSIGGITVSCWATMALYSADIDPSTWEYLVEYLKEKSSILDETKATDWERHLLTIVACNDDPYDFGGINFIEKVTSFFDGTQMGSTSILYDDFFGVLSLISAGIPKQNEIIQKTKSFILTKQESNGGWGDVDATSSAIMALICAGYPSISDEISNGLAYLKTKQQTNGGFYSYDVSNAASTAWAVMAISAAGQNPTNDEWQIQNNNPITFLLSLQNEDGSFNWSSDQHTQSLWMTSYVIPALLGKYYPVNVYAANENENQPPTQPALPTGSSSGIIGQQYTFSTAGNDPDNNKIQYRFDWDAQGNHEYSDWSKFFVSGKKVTFSHSWNKEGTFLIKAQTRDEYNATSIWSDGLAITIKKNNEKTKSWTGNIRIEGKNQTIWKGPITVQSSNILVRNVTTNKMEAHYFTYPSLLGAVDAAAILGGFSYLINYDPSQKTYTLSSINADKNGWYSFVDCSSRQIGSNRYELTTGDSQILIGYLTESTPKALQIKLEDNIVTKHEKCNIYVTDQNDEKVSNARIYIDGESIISDYNGMISVSFSSNGNHYLYAEKEGYIRSDTLIISVNTDIELSKPCKNSLYFFDKEIIDDLKKTWIVGDITLKVLHEEYIEKVEFYINDKLVFSDNETPFQYHLNQRLFFKKTSIFIKSYHREEMNYSLFELLDTIDQLLIKHEVDEIISVLRDFINQINKFSLVPADSLQIDVLIINLTPNINELFETLSLK